MAGIGDAMMAKLRDGGPADTTTLARAADTDPGNAYSRLSFLARTTGKVERLSGKGHASVWRFVESSPTPKPLTDPAAVTETKARVGGPSYGWKPSHAGLDPLSEPATKGFLLLVEYPERWRSSALAQIVREPGEDGVAQCWDLYGKCYCYIDVTGFAARGWRVSRVRTSKQREAILGGNEQEDLDAGG